MGEVRSERVFKGRECALKRDDRFIVMATDGFWEVVNPQACRKIVEALCENYSMDVRLGEEVEGRTSRGCCTGYRCREGAMTMCRSCWWICATRPRR